MAQPGLGGGTTRTGRAGGCTDAPASVLGVWASCCQQPVWVLTAPWPKQDTSHDPLWCPLRLGSPFCPVGIPSHSITILSLCLPWSPHRNPLGPHPASSSSPAQITSILANAYVPEGGEHTFLPPAPLELGALFEVSGDPRWPWLQGLTHHCTPEDPSQAPRTGKWTNWAQGSFPKLLPPEAEHHPCWVWRDGN